MKCRSGSAPSPTGGLLNLPEEILLLIFAYLQPSLKLKSWKPCSKEITELYRSLARLARVSKTCMRIATPLLYYTVELPELPRCQDLTVELPVKSHVKLFFRTLLENASLARLVHRLKVSYYGEDEHSFARGTPSYIGHPASIDRLRMAIPMAQDLWEIIKNRVAESHEDAMLALLVPLCSNLTYLDLKIYPHPRDTASSLLFRTLDEISFRILFANIDDQDFDRTIGMFSKLETVRLQQGNVLELPGDSLGVSDGFRLGTVGSIRLLPAVKSLQCRGAGGLEFPLPNPFPSIAPPGAWSMKSLHLTSSMLSASEIEEALATLPNLREFKYTERQAPNFFGIDHSAVFEALSTYGRKLRVLQFHACNTGGPAGDLKALTKLKELSLSQRTLLGQFEVDFIDLESSLEDVPELTDILPESLTKVKIIPFLLCSSLSLEFIGLEQQDDWVIPSHAFTDYGYLFDMRVVRLCQDPRFTKLNKVTLRRSEDIESGIVPPGWAPSVDEFGWIRLRRDAAASAAWVPHAEVLDATSKDEGLVVNELSEAAIAAQECWDRLWKMNGPSVSRDAPADADGNA